MDVIVPGLIIRWLHFYALTLSIVTSERAHEEQTANKSQTLKGFSWTDGVKTPISTAVTAILDINAWPGTKWSFLNIARLIEMTSKDGRLVE